MAWNGSDSEKVKAEDQGRRRSGNFHSSTSTSYFKLKAVVAAFIVVLIGGLTAWMILGRARTPTAPLVRIATTTSQIKEVKPTVPQKPVTKTHLTTTNLPTAYLNAKGLDPSLFPYKDGRKVLSTRTNKFDQVIDICIMPSGKSRKVVRRAKPPIFNNISDQLLAVSLSGNGDEALPPLPIPSETELERVFVESLKNPIVIKDDDSESVKESKRRVIEAREVVDEQLKQGKSYREILEQHLADRKQSEQLRTEAAKTAMELKSKGDTEGLDTYLKNVNEYLNSQGIRGIGKPASRKDNRSIEK